MKIDNLTLMNFRNYESLNISFGDLNIIYGLNGSGKTNIIEAIYTLALTKSFRINNDKVMIKKGKIKAKINGNVFKNNDENEFGVEISNEGKIVTINGEKQDKVSDYVSRVNVILFNPSDTRLIDEAPSERRRLLNIEISQIYKEYLVILANYQKILKQRNFYLRGMYVNGNYTSTYLDILTKKLIEYGSIICKYRENFIDNINKYITSNFSNTVIKKEKDNTISKSDKIDKVLTHRIWSIPIFLLIMFVVFHLVFSEDLLFLKMKKLYLKDIKKIIRKNLVLVKLWKEFIMMILYLF